LRYQVGGGAFFGKTVGGPADSFGAVGSFDPGFDFDALIIDDRALAPAPMTMRDRLERILYLSDERHIIGKYVRGRRLE
jgi:guanine deaminase